MSSSAAANGLGAKARAFWNHPAGPKTIHFWAPTFKWGITFANIADFSRPVEQISTPQQCAVSATGLIWSRFATQITPVNYNLLTVNAFMAATGLYQLSRKFGLIEGLGGGGGGGGGGAAKEEEGEVKKVSAA